MKFWFLSSLVSILLSSLAIADKQVSTEHLTSIGSSQQAPSTYLLEENSGDWLVRSIKSKPKSLTPYLNITTEGYRIKSYLFESLLRQKHDLSAWDFNFWC